MDGGLGGLGWNGGSDGRLWEDRGLVGRALGSHEDEWRWFGWTGGGRLWWWIDRRGRGGGKREEGGRDWRCWGCDWWGVGDGSGMCGGGWSDGFCVGDDEGADGRNVSLVAGCGRRCDGVERWALRWNVGGG